ncbi:MAG: helix-turn-helix domain-containing protein [Pseudoxanthomonas mexicana]|nr:helix-turn-helix domain-containing protein [Pseudoxanthomonas mexicana]
MADEAIRSDGTKLDNKEAARFLKLSPRTLEKMRVVGGGPRFRKHGRRVLYALVDLEAWSAERVCDSTSDPNYPVR